MTIKATAPAPKKVSAPAPPHCFNYMNHDGCDDVPERLDCRPAVLSSSWNWIGCIASQA